MFNRSGDASLAHFRAYILCGNFSQLVSIGANRKLGAGAAFCDPPCSRNGGGAADGWMAFLHPGVNERCMA